MTVLGFGNFPSKVGFLVFVCFFLGGGWILWRRGSWGLRSHCTVVNS